MGGGRGPKAQVVVLTAADRRQLERVEAAATAAQRDALRARIVLQAAETVPNERIAEELGVTANTVRKWRGRFAAAGQAGLRDRPRPGRPPMVDAVARCRILALACDAPPDAAEACRPTWTILTLQQAVLEAEIVAQVSASTIWRILQHAELRPHRHRMWLHSPDPDFARKVTEVVDLYLHPPANSVVLSIDEKTGMQALERKYPGRRPGLGQPGRREFEYIRHGTRTLLAALNVHTGTVLGHCGPRRRAADLLAFMAEVAAVYPAGDVHVVWDNLNIHRGAYWTEFNRAHGDRFHFHFTPLHASWVNQIECWFSLLARRVLRHGSFASGAELEAAVAVFIRRWNERERHPFRWTFPGYPEQTARAA
jgi:transposase